MKKVLLCLAVAAVAAACDKKDDNSSDVPVPAPEGSMTLGDITWASVNVDGNQQFAAKPDTYTKFYQWNKSTAWAASGSVSGWNSARDTASTWRVNPCPAGWRLPTQAEYQALHNAGTTRADANTRGNAVAGRFYGANHATASLPDNMENCVFFPAVDYRVSSDGTLSSQGSIGYYWSATEYNSSSGYGLFVGSTFSIPYYNGDKANGFTIRCVK